MLAVRLDESAHRDVNHHLADRLKNHQEDLREELKNGGAKLTEKVTWSSLERKNVDV